MQLIKVNRQWRNYIYNNADVDIVIEVIAHAVTEHYIIAQFRDCLSNEDKHLLSVCTRTCFEIIYTFSNLSNDVQLVLIIACGLNEWHMLFTVTIHARS